MQPLRRRPRRALVAWIKGPAARITVLQSGQPCLCWPAVAPSAAARKRDVWFRQFRPCLRTEPRRFFSAASSEEACGAHGPFSAADGAADTGHSRALEAWCRSCSQPRAGLFGSTPDGLHQPAAQPQPPARRPWHLPSAHAPSARQALGIRPKRFSSTVSFLWQQPRRPSPSCLACFTRPSTLCSLLSRFLSHLYPPLARERYGIAPFRNASTHAATAKLALASTFHRDSPLCASPFRCSFRSGLFTRTGTKQIAVSSSRPLKAWPAGVATPFC